VDRINGEHTAEAGRLSQLVVGFSNALVHLGLLPIHDISNSQSQFGTKLGLATAPVALGRPPHHLSIFFFFCPSKWL
jgi:hypothetical protein